MGVVKYGDRVKVTVEGLAHTNGGYTVIHSDSDQWLAEYKNIHLGDGVTVEKVEPPVEVFKPGDVVRDKLCGDVRAIGHDGWFNITQGRWYPGSVDDFTSEGHERVNLDSRSG